MNTSQRVYETTAIDIAAYLSAMEFAVSVRRQVTTYQGEEQPGKYAVFAFEDTQELRDAIIDYDRGGFMKRLMNTRSRLYREASEVMKRGMNRD